MDVNERHEMGVVAGVCVEGRGVGGTRRDYKHGKTTSKSTCTISSNDIQFSEMSLKSQEIFIPSAFFWDVRFQRSLGGGGCNVIIHDL